MRLVLDGERKKFTRYTIIYFTRGVVAVVCESRVKTHIVLKYYFIIIFCDAETFGHSLSPPLIILFSLSGYVCQNHVGTIVFFKFVLHAKSRSRRWHNTIIMRSAGKASKLMILQYHNNMLHIISISGERTCARARSPASLLYSESLADYCCGPSP